MEEEFITYQKFDDPALAEALADMLEANGIPYTIVTETTGFDPSMVMSNAPTDYAVKVKTEDFERIHQIQLKQEQENTANVEKDHYLFLFTDEELLDVIKKADEWSVFDVVLARKILSERGKTITEETIVKMEQERLTVLSQTESHPTAAIWLGYLTAVMGGALGILIGWFLANGKKTLPNGERVYWYSDHDRRQGWIIFYLGLACFIIVLIIRFDPNILN